MATADPPRPDGPAAAGPTSAPEGGDGGAVDPLGEPWAGLPVLGVLAGALVASRVGAHLAGVRFDAEPLSYATQIVDVEVLQDHLVESVWYLHSQPPLYNLVLGTVLRWSPLPDATSLHVLHLVASAALLLGLFDLCRQLGVGRWPATAVAVVLGCGPPVLLYESWLSYEHPVSVLLVWQAAAAARWVRGGRPAALAAVAGLGAAAVLSRSLLHPVWLVVVVGLALALRRPARWRPALLAAGLPLLLVVGVMAKNQVLFGSSSLSSWTGFNVHRVAVGSLPPEVRDQLREDGVLTAPPVAEPCEVSRPDVAVLAEELKRGGRGAAGIGNANWDCLRPWYDALGADAWAAVQAEPGLVAEGVAGSAEIWGGPSTLHFSLMANREALGGWEVAYRRAVLGDVAWEPPVEVPGAWALVASAPDQRQHLSLTIVAATALVLAAALAGLARWARGRRPGPATAAVVVGGATVAFVTAGSILFEHGENHRIRYVAEPLTLCLAAGIAIVVVGRAVARRRRRSAAGGPSPAADADVIT